MVYEFYCENCAFLHSYLITTQTNYGLTLKKPFSIKKVTKSPYLVVIVENHNRTEKDWIKSYIDYV